MTEAQRQKYNQMAAVLRSIAKDYQAPEQLRKNAKKDYGLSYQEALEMAYENIQADAARASKGVKHIHPPKPQR